MKKITFIVAISFAAWGLANAQTKKNNSNKPTMTTKSDKMSYALGISVASNIKSQGVDTVNAQLIAKAFDDIYKGLKTDMTPEEAGMFLNQYFSELQKVKLEKNKIAGEKFLEENKKKPGVITLPSGLQYTVIKEGDGPKPLATDKVKTHYHGTLIDGTVFDSSVQRNDPAVFPVNGVISGWVEALQLMKVGSKWKLFVPSNLAYGERGAGEKIGPNTTLIFEVELLSIEK